jgi:hypothetical protein
MSLDLKKRQKNKIVLESIAGIIYKLKKEKEIYDIKYRENE